VKREQIEAAVQQVDTLVPGLIDLHKAKAADWVGWNGVGELAANGNEDVVICHARTSIVISTYIASSAADLPTVEWPNAPGPLALSFGSPDPWCIHDCGSTSSTNT
jgi:hypothetical protein